jgi:hypothetical protein
MQYSAIADLHTCQFTVARLPWPARKNHTGENYVVFSPKLVTLKKEMQPVLFSNKTEPRLISVHRFALLWVLGFYICEMEKWANNNLDFKKF